MRRIAPRGGLLLAIGAAHLSLVLGLLKAGGARPPEIAGRTLTLFDLAIPAPPPIEPPPPPPVEPARIAPAARPATRAGGAPGHDRAPPARRVADERTDRPSAFESTITDTALPIARAEDGGGSAPIDQDRGGATGADIGAGNGTGDGGGTGSGSGTGSGDAGTRWARAAWVVYPSRAELNRYMPRAAVLAEQPGRVLLACTVRRVGRPDHCGILYENPGGWDFGKAALAMSPAFRIRPVRRNGRIESDIPVVVPVVFEVAGKPTPP